MFVSLLFTKRVPVGEWQVLTADFCQKGSLPLAPASCRLTKMPFLSLLPVGGVCQARPGGEEIPHGRAAFSVGTKIKFRQYGAEFSY